MVIDDLYKRDKQVWLQKPTETTTAGKTVITWADYVQAWVAVEPLRGREYWEAQQQASSATHKLTGLWDDFENITAAYRVRYSSRTFNLLEPPRNLEEASVLAEVFVEEEKG